MRKKIFIFFSLSIIACQTKHKVTSSLPPIIKTELLTIEMVEHIFSEIHNHDKNGLLTQIIRQKTDTTFVTEKDIKEKDFISIFSNVDSNGEKELQKPQSFTLYDSTLFVLQKTTPKNNLKKNKIEEETLYYKSGVFKNQIYKKTQTNPINNTITIYESSIDTTELAIEQFINKETISPEYLDYYYEKTYIRTYNTNNQLIKEIYYPPSKLGEIKKTEIRVYQYDQFNHLISQKKYDFNANEKLIINPEKEDIYFSKKYEYQYDKYGNWTQLKSFRYNYYEEPFEKYIRKITYY